MNRTYTYVVGIVVIVLLVILGWFLLTPTPLPWTPSGQLTIVVKASPGDRGGSQLGFGVDDMTLYTNQGESVRATLRTRRVLLDPSSNELTLLLQTDAPVGEYSAFSFVIKSPELRNAWEEDTPPQEIVLVGESIHMPISYSIEEDSTTAVVLSFETKTALHTFQEKLFYTPVVQVETRKKARVTLSENGTVFVEGGEVGGIGTYGMDWNGAMRFNYRANISEYPLYAPPTPTLEVMESTTSVDEQLEEKPIETVGTTTQEDVLESTLHSTTTNSTGTDTTL